MKLKNGIQIVAFLFILLIAGCDDETSDPVLKAPGVSSTNPADKATAVGLNQLITVSFNDAMDAATISPSTFIVKQGTTTVAGELSFKDSTATFTSANALEANTMYTAEITTEVMNLSGMGLPASHTFSFTTGAAPDNTAPLLSSTDPANNATDIERNKVISITFSEEMDPASINTTTFTLKLGTTTVAGTVAYSGTIATFNPDNDLLASQTYTASITKAAKDLAGNTLDTDTEWNFTTGGSTTAMGIVNLGASANYVILAKTAINNNSTSAVTGDLGLSPAATSYITGMALTNATGYATSDQVTGKVYAADMADPTPINLTTAVENMITAYNDAAGRPSPDFSELGTGNIGGKTLTPGLYKWSSKVTMPADVVLSGGENDVWIFQIAGDLNMSAAVRISLSGGAQARNIFWQVAGETTIGTTAHFEGIILSMTGITFQTGASLNGRAFAQTAVILDSNAVTAPQ